jgi:hypothetical protein
MSTLNVANISDDQSTLTGSSSNPDDKLHFNTTTDTKFVTNGCAKAFGTCGEDGSLTARVGSTLNISSTQSTATGVYQYDFTSNLKSGYVAVSVANSNNFRNCPVMARNVNHVQTVVRDVSGTKTDTKNSVAIHGDLA